MNKDIEIKKLKSEIKILESSWEELKDFLEIEIQNSELKTLNSDVCELCYGKVRTKIVELEVETLCKFRISDRKYFLELESGCIENEKK